MTADSVWRWNASTGAASGLQLAPRRGPPGDLAGTALGRHKTFTRLLITDNSITSTASLTSRASFFGNPLPHSTDKSIFRTNPAPDNNHGGPRPILEFQ